MKNWQCDDFTFTTMSQTYHWYIIQYADYVARMQQRYNTQYDTSLSTYGLHQHFAYSETTKQGRPVAKDPTLVWGLPCTHLFHSPHGNVSEVTCKAAGVETGAKLNSIQLDMHADKLCMRCFYLKG